MAIIICPNCGKSISDKAKVCVHCSKSFNDQNTRLCPECGAIISSTDKTCSNCGFPISELGEVNNDAPTQDISQDQKEKMTKRLWPIIVAIVLLMVVTGVFIFFRIKCYETYMYTFSQSQN